MAEQGMNPEIAAQSEEARNHALQNIVDSNNAEEVCSDGRYTQEQAEGANRVFGGTAGSISAVAGAMEKLGMKVDIENLLERFDLYLNRPSNNRDGKKHIHTGCGHIAQIVQDYSWGKELKEAIEDDIEKDKTVEDVLEGEHLEKGVLFVNSEKKTLRSVDPKTKEQWFVTDIKKDKEHMMILPEKLGLGIPGSLVWDTYVEQMNRTAQALATKLGRQLPVFEVNLDTAEPQIKYLQTIYPLA